METSSFAKKDLPKEKGDDSKASQIGHDNSSTLDVTRETAQRNEEIEAKYSQESTQPGTLGSKDTKKDVKIENSHQIQNMNTNEIFEYASEYKPQKSDISDSLYRGLIDIVEGKRQDIHNTRLSSVEELKYQAKMVLKLIEEHKIDFPLRSNKRLEWHWKRVEKLSHNDYFRCFKQSLKPKEVKNAISGYLLQVQISLKDARQFEQFQKQTPRLEAATNLIIHHEKEFQEIGYNFKQFQEMSKDASSLKDVIWKYHNDQGYLSDNHQNLFIAYCEAIGRMGDDLESFLKIDPDLERKKVSEREKRIEELLEALPEVRLTLSDLPREQWWKLYLDGPMHKEAQKLSDPGLFFDQDQSPGYQQSMIALFEKVLLPAQDRSQKSMNYEDYTNIHETATEYVPDQDKNLMRTPGGLVIVQPLGDKEVLGSSYYLGEVGDKEVLGSSYYLGEVGDKEMHERLKALEEIREERINGLPLLQNWQSEGRSLQEVKEELAYSSPNTIVVALVGQPKAVALYHSRAGEIDIIPAYRREDGPQHVNSILELYYQGRERPDQTEYQRLREIARTVRALHVMHPKGDGNGRTHIFGLMNKWLIEEGFPPAILPNGPGVFGGLKTLDGLVADMLEGMHAFVNTVEESRKER